jgi:hypothetical protein
VTDAPPEDFLDRHGETIRFDPRGETLGNGKLANEANPSPRTGGPGGNDVWEMDDDPIPPRGWLLGNTFCREF